MLKKAVCLVFGGGGGDQYARGCQGLLHKPQLWPAHCLLLCGSSAHTPRLLTLTLLPQLPQEPGATAPFNRKQSTQAHTQRRGGEREGREGGIRSGSQNG